jgi:hypothetical protein
MSVPGRDQLRTTVTGKAHWARRNKHAPALFVGFANKKRYQERALCSRWHGVNRVGILLIKQMAGRRHGAQAVPGR